MDRLSLDRLIVSQHGLRYPAGYLHRMMDFVASGGIWTESALRAYAEVHGDRHWSLIALSQFPAAAGGVPPLVVHDGHHRLVATHLAGRDFLHADEYRITPWTWEDYLAINFEVGWVTPFDPRTHVRKADFLDWKKKILKIAETDPALATRLIGEEAETYREARRYGDVASLAHDCCWEELACWRRPGPWPATSPTGAR